MSKPTGPRARVSLFVVVAMLAGCSPQAGPPQGSMAVPVTVVTLASRTVTVSFARKS